MMTFDQIRFIASATVNDQMISSTHGKGIDRKDFDGEMENAFFLLPISIPLKNIYWCEKLYPWSRKLGKRHRELFIIH